MKLLRFEVISPGCNAHVVRFQQLLGGPMEVLLCERVNDLRQSLFHLLNCHIPKCQTQNIFRAYPPVGEYNQHNLSLNDKAGKVAENLI